MSYQLLKAQATKLPLADESVQCVVTSPPYWGLRKYSGEQELIWEGNPNWWDCPHQWAEETVKREIRTGLGLAEFSKQYRGGGKKQGEIGWIEARRGTCITCGAWKGAYGLEPTVEMYVQHTVEILREIRRVLRADGVLFWNLGDSYAANRGNTPEKPGLDNKNKSCDALPIGHNREVSGLKPKDLCLIPARVALAAQADGWWIRSDIIWAKPNPMPESVRDRPTDAYEHILMLTKSARYFWDAEAVKEPSLMRPQNRFTRREDHPKGDEGRALHRRPEGGGWQAFGYAPKGAHSKGKKLSPPCETSDKAHLADGRTAFKDWHKTTSEILPMRNLRNVWIFATRSYKGAHFATFPEELPRRCIKAASKVGDTVLDPFCGSGTTGKVALELGRDFIGTDLAYQELAEERIRKFLPPLPVGGENVVSLQVAS